MRKLMALALVLVTAALGLPVGLAAQTAARPGSVSGEAVDAGGRALVSQRVELVLVQVSDVVQTTTTGSRGEWAFANVAPGDYVVRMLVNGQVTGIRVSVPAGQAVASALIVVPASAAPSAQFGALGVLGGTLLMAGIAAAVITTVVITTGS
jgi:hypothetical protein